MPDKVRLKVDKDELTIEEGDTTFLGKMFKGAKGKINLGRRSGNREIHKIKDSKGKVYRDDKHPQNVGKVEKPKKK